MVCYLYHSHLQHQSLTINSLIDTHLKNSTSWLQQYLVGRLIATMILTAGENPFHDQLHKKIYEVDEYSETDALRSQLFEACSALDRALRNIGKIPISYLPDLMRSSDATCETAGQYLKVDLTACLLHLPEPARASAEKTLRSTHQIGAQALERYKAQNLTYRRRVHAAFAQSLTNMKAIENDSGVIVKSLMESIKVCQESLSGCRSLTFLSMKNVKKFKDIVARLLRAC